jgi:hypothetical protein
MNRPTPHKLSDSFPLLICSLLFAFFSSLSSLFSFLFSLLFFLPLPETVADDFGMRRTTRMGFHPAHSAYTELVLVQHPLLPKTAGPEMAVLRSKGQLSST